MSAPPNPFVFDTPEAVFPAYNAPFPWFGGKRRVAHIVWQWFGDTPNYVEPFAGSLAVLLRRPHAPRLETVNDLDVFIPNFWRALRADPRAVAEHADYPVLEADLHARHRWLVTKGAERIERLRTDPEFYDAQVAGWWVWGICCWIGGGWCSDAKNNKRPRLTGFSPGGVGVHSATQQQKPACGGSRTGMGVHSLGSQKPYTDQGGRGVHRRGINAMRTRLAGDVGIHCASRTDGIYAWFEELADRLRRVRVLCGDWSRVLTPAVTCNNGLTGVFLDPPYAPELREGRCYAAGDADADLSARVRAWALANGDNPLLRIAYCSYGEDPPMPGWKRVHWKAAGGYGNQTQNGRGRDNAKRETIDFSPHCLVPGTVPRQTSIFDLHGVEAAPTPEPEDQPCSP